MRSYGTFLPIQHEQAQQFFEEARRPNLEAIRRRDAFLERLERECPYRREGSGLVMEIPDLDIPGLTAEAPSGD